MSHDPRIARIVLKAWSRTRKNPSYAAWDSLARMAAGVAVHLALDFPNSTLPKIMDTIAAAAEQNKLAMQREANNESKGGRREIRNNQGVQGIRQ